MPLYHAEMHTAIWEWIQGWCNGEALLRRFSQYPKNPIDLLRNIVEMIDVSEDSLAPYVVEGPEWAVSGARNLENCYLYGFAEKICRVGQSLYSSELQHRLSWISMKKILEFYLRDAEEYISKVKTLGYNPHELGIDWETWRTRALSEEDFHAELIWSRYITGNQVWKWSPGVGRFIPKILDGTIGEYWAENVISVGVIGYYEYTYDIYIDSEEEEEHPLTEVQEKKNEAIRKVQEVLDIVQEDIGDGLYLQFANMIKEHYVVSS